MCELVFFIKVLEVIVVKCTSASLPNIYAISTNIIKSLIKIRLLEIIYSYNVTYNLSRLLVQINIVILVN